MSFKDELNTQALPRHVAIIMDGNGRWAKERGKIRTFGHRHGVSAVRDTVEGAAEVGVEYLTLYAFSTENWSRPKFEIDALMELLIHTIGKETKTLIDNNIRLQAIGNIKSLPKSCVRELHKAMEETKNNTRMTLVLALSYSSRWEITEAARKIAKMAEEGQIQSNDVNEELLTSHLTTAGIPDPELLIRTSGEHRVSNYLLWQIAYAELYFTEKLWPDFRREDLFEAIVDFQKRERRFGGVNAKKSARQHA